jgi:hypothetical protein
MGSSARSGVNADAERTLNADQERMRQGTAD